MAGQGHHHQGGVPSLSHHAASSSSSSSFGEGPTLGYREKEVQCVLHWFQNWSPLQKDDFLRLLLEQAMPSNVDLLFQRLQTMEVRDRPPSIFQCQLKLASAWLQEWTFSERKDFMGRLSMCDQAFVARFEQTLLQQQCQQEAGMAQPM